MTRLLALAVWALAELVPAAGQAQSCSYTSPQGGAAVNFAALGNPAGNIVDTPLGNARMNPCSKVTLCDAIQPGSICCIQVNDTAHPGTGAWVSCGSTFKFTTAMSEASMIVGMVLENGADCGYVFATAAKVTASIAFTCDRSATGGGRITTSPTAFLKAPTAVAGGGLIGAKPTLDPKIFCNLNFTWATSQVCNLPFPKGHGPGDWGLVMMLLIVAFCGIYFGGFTYYRSNQPGADPVVSLTPIADGRKMFLRDCSRFQFWNNLHSKEMWNEIPALVKDGAAFLQSGGQSNGHFSQYAAVDDVEEGAPKKTPPRKKVALPPKKTAGPPARKSQEASEDGDDDEK